jgi:hypothetical protein
LEWVVSLDGKKMQSETYRVLAVLDKPATQMEVGQRTTVALSGCYAPADSCRAVRDPHIMSGAQYLLLAIDPEPKC